MEKETPPQTEISLADLATEWGSFTSDERNQRFSSLSRTLAEDLFFMLSTEHQAELLEGAVSLEKRSWIRLLEPDDAADLIQALPDDRKSEMLALLDAQTRHEVNALLVYAEDDAGGLMNPRFARLRPEMDVDEAVRYLRHQAQANLETIYYAYVLDSEQKLLGVVSFRDLLSAPPQRHVKDVMQPDVVSVREDLDQEELGRLFAAQHLLALPVVDAENRMKGIVTFDDVVHAVQEEATEDIQKLGGVEALDAPYLKTGLLEMIRKRAVWLLVLFVGEMFTATAMGYYEQELERAIVLALFIPLIISSGGNSGSQATTLVIRAMAVGEVRLKDWWRVFVREISTGLALGLILGVVGLLRIVYWPSSLAIYGPHYVRIAVTVSISVVGTVLWGTVTGSMLPFILRRFGLDPASASAPFVATLVDVTGLVIYFTVASLILGGTLL